MADTQHPQSTNAPAAKTRSPVERVVVWGLIGALAVAAGFEFQSKNGHAAALKKLQDKIDAVDRDPKQPEVTEHDVKEAVAGKMPSSTKDYEVGTRAANGAKRLEIYTWFTLNPTSKREMWVYYAGKGKDADELAAVLQISETDIATMPAPAVAQSSDADKSGPPAGRGAVGVPGGMQGGAMGPQGGGPRGDGRRGGATADTSADSAATADADKNDAKPADVDKPADADAEKTADDKSGEEKPPEKTEKTE